MLGGMRLQVEVRPEDEDPLRSLAHNDHRSVREQASFFLHLKIHEELVRLGLERESEPLPEVA
jgi:hypothetical protein